MLRKQLTTSDRKHLTCDQQRCGQECSGSWCSRGKGSAHVLQNEAPTPSPFRHQTVWTCFKITCLDTNQANFYSFFFYKSSVLPGPPDRNAGGEGRGECLDDFSLDVVFLVANLFFYLGRCGTSPCSRCLQSPGCEDRHSSSRLSGPGALG